MRLFFTAIFICAFTLKLSAQQDSLKKTTTTVALLYNSNISYYGQQTTENYPYLLANATVKLPFGLYFSASAYKLLQEETGALVGDLGMGYDYQFNDQFTAGLAFNRSFFPTNSPLLAASNENNINFTLSYEGNWLSSSLSADYAFGKQQDVFLGLTNSKTIELGSFLSEKNSFSITPTIEIVAGTRRFYETYSIEKETRLNGKGKGIGLGSAPSSTTISTTTIEKNGFNLLSYNFKLPLTLSRASYLIEANYQFSILGNSAADDLKRHSSIYGLAFYYQF